MSKQYEAQILRELAFAHGNTAKLYANLADFYDQGIDKVGGTVANIGLSDLITGDTARVWPEGERVAAMPDAPPAPPAAGTRKRRTKAEIAADEAALAEQGGAPTAPLAGQTPPPPPPPPPPAALTQAPPPPPLPAITGPSIDEVQKAFVEVVAATEVHWKDHGEGQAGILLEKCGFQTVHSIPTEHRQKVIDHCKDFCRRFPIGELPQAAGTPGFITAT